MNISTILATKGDFVATVTPDATVADLLATLAEHGIGAAVVSRDGRIVEGIASERDVARTLASQGADVLHAPVADIMTAVISTCSPDSTIADIAAQMTDNRTRHVPVMDEHNELIGIVSIGDLVKARIDALEEERRNLVSYITT